MTTDPAEVVSRQLAAYNARDAVGFCACYAPDVTVIDLDSGVIRLSGMEAFAAAYRAQFERWPMQRAELRHRHIVGNLVFDTEHVTGVPDRHDALVVGIYRVSGDLIDRVWFTPRFASA